jgi:ring-1,2-phenylacetyl-CoA epoxidase subunit PaaE
MSRFHALTVTDIRRETCDAVVVTLSPREEDRAIFNFTQGQYLTFRRKLHDKEYHRCYSICSGKDEGVLKVGIKKVNGGVFSGWANETLKQGDVIEALPPMGRFFSPIKPDAQTHYLGFAGGSGITPILSIIKTVLCNEPHCRFTLVYANRQFSSIMFREELDDIKNTYLARFSILHMLENDAQDLELLRGRVDGEKIAALFTTLIDPATVDVSFVCGPEPMMEAIVESLQSHGLQEDQIKIERFASARPAQTTKIFVPEARSPHWLVQVNVTLDGTRRTFTMPRNGMSLLDAAIASQLDVPFACKSGVCSTCKAKMLDGEFEMRANFALEDAEICAGYVLTCQCYPLSNSLTVTFDY